MNKTDIQKIRALLADRPQGYRAKTISSKTGIDVSELNRFFYSADSSKNGIERGDGKGNAPIWKLKAVTKAKITIKEESPVSRKKRPKDQISKKEKKKTIIGSRNDPFGLDKELKRIYGKTAEFREGQKEAILAVLNREKTLVVQRTGWGKSLVYFLAIKKLREMGAGPAIIISPLLALMRDQRKAAGKFKLNIKEIASSNQSEWDDIYREIDKGKIDALLISPERINNPAFHEKIGRHLGSISLFVVDEAHCISDWGHDFRPGFQRIVKLIRELSPSTPILATTATANKRVVSDIKKQLGKGLNIQRGSMDRPNIGIDVYSFNEDSKKVEWLLNTIPRLVERGSGIIYCLKIEDCDKVAAALAAHGIAATAYYSRIDSDERTRIEQDFQHNKIKLLVATTAFGMGIDKDDISFVIHFQKPASAIAYYQQIGRAGRNIEKAYAVLLSGNHDDEINEYFIKTAFPTERESTECIKLLDISPGISFDEIKTELNWRRDRCEKVIEYLCSRGAIRYEEDGYYSTENDSFKEHIRIVSSRRWKELKRMNEFVSTDHCYMSFIRGELDDETEIMPCGKCANCLKHHLNFEEALGY